MAVTRKPSCTCLWVWSPKSDQPMQPYRHVPTRSPLLTLWHPNSMTAAATASIPRPTRMCSDACLCCPGVQTAHAACPAGIRRETLCEHSPARCSPQRSTATPAPRHRSPGACGRDGAARRLHAPWAAAAASVRAFNKKLPVPTDARAC